MSERMYRAQVLLEPRQRKRLEERARREGRSISAVTRQVIDAGLDALESEAEVWKRRMQVIAELRARWEGKPIEYHGNLVEEAWQEREDEQGEIWQPKSS